MKSMSFYQLFMQALNKPPSPQNNSEKAYALPEANNASGIIITDPKMELWRLKKGGCSNQ